MCLIFFFMAFSFTKHRKVFYGISLVAVVFSLLSPWILRPNLGIDMTGGIQIEYFVSGGEVDRVVESTKTQILAQVEASLDADMQNALTDTLVYRVTGTDHFIIEAGINEAVYKKSDGTSDLDRIEATKVALVDGLQKAYSANAGTKVEQIRYVNIGASFGEYIKNSGYLTLTLAVIAISMYIMYAFSGSIQGIASWPFAVVTGVSLVHDVIVAFGFYLVTGVLFPEFKIDTFFITAMLTVLGYSINDTIVILDRVRSNLKENAQKSRPLPQVIDSAIHGTLRRSIFTSLTVVIVLVAMFMFGPDSISGFVLALIFGTIVGTYSSIFLAAPMLIDLVKHSNQKK